MMVSKKILTLGLLGALLGGSLLATVNISDARSNGFWRRPSVFWKAGTAWETREIGRIGEVEIPEDCRVFFISIPDKYVRAKDYFFRFQRSALLELRGCEKYVIHWVPDDRMTPLWLTTRNDKYQVHYCKGAFVRGLPSRSGLTTALSIRGAGAAVANQTVPK